MNVKPQAADAVEMAKAVRATKAWDTGPGSLSLFHCMFRSRLSGSTRLLSRIGRPIRSQHTENGPGSPYSAKRNSFLNPTFVALGLIPVLTFALGTWQVQRLRWKVDLIDQLTEKLQREPIPLPSKVK
jgi:hypothetical protein